MKKPKNWNYSMRNLWQWQKKSLPKFWKMQKQMQDSKRKYCEKCQQWSSKDLSKAAQKYCPSGTGKCHAGSKKKKFAQLAMQAAKKLLFREKVMKTAMICSTINFLAKSRWCRWHRQLLIMVKVLYQLNVPKESILETQRLFKRSAWAF